MFADRPASHIATHPAAATSRSSLGRRRPIRAGAIAFAVMLFAAACSPAGVDRDPDGTGSRTVGLARGVGIARGRPPGARGAASEPPSASVLLPEPDVLPRALSYGILNWTVTDTAITNENPATYVPGVAGAPTPNTSLIVDFEIRNDSPHVGFVTTTSRLVAQLPDGTVIEGKDLERPSAAPESTVESRYAFEVPAETVFDGLVLRFEDPGREPSLDLPLSGSAPEVEADSATEIDETIAVGIPGIEMEWTIDTLLTGATGRCRSGSRAARASPAPAPRPATSGSASWPASTSTSATARAASSTRPDRPASSSMVPPFTAAADESSKPIMTTSTFSDVMLVFDIPAEASDAVLQVGPLEEPDQQATLNLGLD